MSAPASSSTAPRASSRIAVAVVAGVLFGLGLGISGMSRPAKVLGFLDVAGAWDPSLAFVMIGAIGVHALAVLVAKRRVAPLGGGGFHWAEKTSIDGPLLAGAALFGIGWGLGGYCPGPALLSAASGSVPAGIFVTAMILGMIVRHASVRRAPARTS
ncbi:MAG: uncharacterized protein QOI41_7408 [Myxococcales bacterium]|nr:uncharacterized protein [Myxococcales bacterium]